MAETESENDEKVWKKFLRKHWGIVIVFIIGAIVVVAGALYVFLWFVNDAQTAGLVPTTLGLWATNHLVWFLIYLILWEILLVGIPVIIAVVLGYFLWWKRLPREEREDYRHRHLFGKRSRRSDGGNAFSFLIFIGFIIKIYVDGNWNKPFELWTFNYLASSLVWVIIWILIIFGIPMTIGGCLWLHHEMKKES
ncbi:MAG TPA: hypothetical protein DSN98_02470 [Thermoplasmata archaeon]|jgi:hypothetical protein|nr:MAG TPA: hypothetical protein DSN98_02470 [Thermoplasmata archaeon]